MSHLPPSRFAHLHEERKPLPTRDELPSISPRLAGLCVLFGICMAAFTIQVYRLTILKGEHFKDLSENNFIREVAVLAPRGRILDRHGKALASNHTLYDIEMSPFRLEPDAIRRSVERIARLLNRPESITRADEIVALRPRWKTRTLATHLTLDEVLPILEQQFRLPGVMVEAHYRRYYPFGSATGLVTGHVGKITPQQKTKYVERGYLAYERIGQLGAERRFEELLHGTPGREIVIRDARGRPRRRHISEPAQGGRTVLLTLDRGLQRRADALLEGWRGVIVAIDPRDGAVLAMAARPNYDANRPDRGYSYNKAVKGVFAPGSTFKVFTAAAGLSQGRSPEETTFCDGLYHLPGVRLRFPCHLKWGHGALNMHQALKKSCNVYFYRWAHKVGARHMIATAAAFGFGRPTGFDLMLPGEESHGTLARPGIDPIYLGSVLHMGIGQGQLLAVTPLQLARAYSALATDGVLHRPRIVQEVLEADGTRVPYTFEEADPPERIPISEADRKRIVAALRSVVAEPGGTGHYAGLKPEWRVAGKTGTAQTFKGRTPDAWFACFAPVEDPEICLVVLVEESGHGGDVAGPVARQLLAYWFGEPEPEIVPPPHEPEEAPEETE